MVRKLGFIFGLVLCLAPASPASVWRIEPVEQSGTSRFSSLKMDRNGDMHVVYVVEDEKQTLKYGFWDHQSKHWFTMKIAEFASFSSLTLDSKQHPHISWADAGTTSGARLRYAYWDGTEWKRRPIPLDSDIIGYYTSIALDPDDNPCISFYEYQGPKGSDLRVRLRVVMWNGVYWEVKTIDGQNQSGKFNAIAIDREGRIHIAYANVGAMTAGMRYAFWNGRSWMLEVVEGLRENDGKYVGAAANIALDKDGNPHITYMNDSNGLVKYATRKGGKWHIEVVDRVMKVAYPDRNAIAITEDGQPYIGYFDGIRRVLRIAHKEGDKWLVETVDSEAGGFTSSLQVGQGHVWVSYTDEKNAGLKVAHLDPADQKMLPVPPPPPGYQSKAK